MFIIDPNKAWVFIVKYNKKIYHVVYPYNAHSIRTYNLVTDGITASDGSMREFAFNQDALCFDDIHFKDRLWYINIWDMIHITYIWYIICFIYLCIFLSFSSCADISIYLSSYPSIHICDYPSIYPSV